MNAWVLAKELEHIAERSGDPGVERVCELVRTHYAYPVDSVLIAPDLDVLGHVNVQDARALDPRGYLGFLREGLAKARGEPPPGDEPPAHPHAGGRPMPPPLRLTPESPSGSLLDLVRRATTGGPALRFFAIDATAFEGPIEIELEVRVDGGDLPGRFELCAAPDDDPGLMSPVATLAQVAPGATDRVSYAFRKGALFGLAVMPAPGVTEGEPSAFLATLTVRAR